MTGAKKTKKKKSIEEIIADKSEFEVWEMLETKIIEFYCENTGVKAEHVTPEIRRALCAGYSFCSGHYGSAIMIDPSSIFTWSSPEVMLKSAKWIMDNRLKKPIGN